MKAFFFSADYRAQHQALHNCSQLNPLIVTVIVVTVCWDCGCMRELRPPGEMDLLPQRPLVRKWMSLVECHCNATGQPLLHSVQDSEPTQANPLGKEGPQVTFLRSAYPHPLASCALQYILNYSTVTSIATLHFHVNGKTIREPRWVGERNLQNTMCKETNSFSLQNVLYELRAIVAGPL